MQFQTPSGFTFAGKSIAEMWGVHWEITVPAHIAIRSCPVDFTFFDGLRTGQEQARNVATGASRTLETKHLTGDAGDLVPWVDGKLSWDWPPCILVARSMREAIRFLGISQTWGGVWDRRLEDLSDDLEREVSLYHERYKAKHGPLKKPLFDGVHFERART